VTTERHEWQVALSAFLKGLHACMRVLSLQGSNIFLVSSMNEPSVLDFSPFQDTRRVWALTIFLHRLPKE